MIDVGTKNTEITGQTAAEERLQQSRRVETLGRLTAGVAHDFNNLLSVIIGNAELLQDRLGGDVELILGVLRAAGRGTELTQRLLAFASRRRLHLDVVDPGALVDGMRDVLSRALGETIEIRLSHPPDLWTVMTDPGQLESALLNLAVNARDAMPGGGVLGIETANVILDPNDAAARPESATGEYVTLAVTDDGSGMPPEVRERAFEPFFTTKDVGAGSGLGLSIVDGFVKQTGGHVSINSEEGRGTTIKLFLPRTEKRVERAAARAMTDEPPGRGETILVVDVDAGVRSLVVSILERLDYDVVTARHAKAAAAILESSPRIDLLLSDVALPRGMSGLAFAQRAKSRHPRVKVLFMSAYAEPTADHDGALGLGGRLLMKPFGKRELARQVRAVLDGD